MATLFTDFLTALGVRHTAAYSDKRFEEMPFQSMFGLSKLLDEYGVTTSGVSVDATAKADVIRELRLPFLADTPEGFLVVTDIAGDDVTYISEHEQFTAPFAEIVDSWNGIALLAQPRAGAGEPKYERHHVGVMMTGVKHCLLIVLAAALAGLAMWQSGLYADWAAWLLLAANCAGIAFSWLLVQKSLGISGKAAETICSALEEGGCDEIAQSEASSFFGIFKWSEVGLAYFGVSVVAMLLFPSVMPWLAGINILCLPYTVWSITYQRFVAKTWCTLCVCVQATLWVLFAGYLLGGWTSHVFPLGLGFFELGAVYVAVMLAINRIDDFLLKKLPRK